MYIRKAIWAACICCMMMPQMASGQSLKDVLKKAAKVLDQVRQPNGVTLEDLASQVDLSELLNAGNFEAEVLERDSVGHWKGFKNAIAATAVNPQQTFPKSLAAGNYSGIAWLGGNSYALVDDKSATDGFRLVDMDIDPASGKILSIKDKGFVSSGNANRDGEGIAWVPDRGTIFMAGESDNAVYEYKMDGKRTGKSLPTGEIFGKNGNYGLESLAYDAESHTFWTTTESTLPSDGKAPAPGSGDHCLLRIQSFGSDLKPKGQWLYETDAPSCTSADGIFVFGVSELCAMPNGRLLALERESYIPQNYAGAYVVNKIYEMEPSRKTRGKVLKKHLVASFRTGMDYIDRSFANYEGMCLGPELQDGSRVLILVADSQNQYKGVLKDWFMTIKISPAK